MNKILKDEAEWREILEERSKVKELTELLTEFHKDHPSSNRRRKWSPMKLDFRRTSRASTLATIREMSRKCGDVQPPSRKNSDTVLKRLERTSSTDFGSAGGVPMRKSSREELKDLMFWARKTKGEEANAINSYQGRKQRATKPRMKYPNPSKVEVSRPAWNSCCRIKQPKPQYLPRTPPSEKKRNAVSKVSMVKGKSSITRPHIPNNLGPLVSQVKPKRRGPIRKSDEAEGRPCHFSRRHVVVTSSSGGSIPGLALSTDILRPSVAKHNLVSRKSDYPNARSSGLGGNARTSRLQKQSVRKKFGGNAIQKGKSFGSAYEQAEESDYSVEILWRADYEEAEDSQEEPEDISTSGSDPIEANMSECSLGKRISKSDIGLFEQTKDEFSGEELDTTPSPSNQPIENSSPGNQSNEGLKLKESTVTLLAKVRSALKVSRGDDDPSVSRISSEVERGSTDANKGCFGRFFSSIRNRKPNTSAKPGTSTASETEVSSSKKGLFTRISKGLTNIFGKRNRVAPTTENI